MKYLVSSFLFLPMLVGCVNGNDGYYHRNYPPVPRVEIERSDRHYHDNPRYQPAPSAPGYRNRPNGNAVIVTPRPMQPAAQHNVHGNTNSRSMVNQKPQNSGNQVDTQDNVHGHD